MYYIEDEFYKNRIISSNKQMIENCDILVCYVDEKVKNSGSKRILSYAKKKGLKIINLFSEV